VSSGIDSDLIQMLDQTNNILFDIMAVFVVYLLVLVPAD